MLVSSIISPSHRSSLQLIVVHCNDERVLVPVELHAKYSDLQTFITKEWTLEDQAFFIETDELDICAGKRVRIHEEAWLGIKDIVGNIYVRVRRTERWERKNQLLASFKNEVKQEEAPTFRAASESADEAEVEHQTIAEIHKNEYVDETPTVRRCDQESKQDKRGRSESPKKQRPQGDTLNLFSDEADASARSESEPQKETEEHETSKENPTPQPRPTWKTFLDNLHRSSPSTTSITPSTSVVPTPTGPSTRSQNKSKAKNATAPSVSSGDPERVLIIVEPPSDSIYEPRGFRIRREHSVKTVLKGACKAFKIDYTRTRLRMLTEMSSEDDNESNETGEHGELVTVKCNNGDTMSSLNVEDNQRFVIEMVDGDEDGDGDEESEA